jgi:hypothetical protein
VGFLGASDRPKKVLMLGLGDGAAIRPILSSSPDCELTCVDFDEESIETCRDIYTNNFPQLRFCAIRSEALEYLGKTTEKFDVVVVDLYTREQYAPVVFSKNFHDLLANCLGPHGHIVCNAYGIPAHLDPFEGSSPQAFLARRFADKWGSVRYLPYRRNSTLIVGSDAFPGVDKELDVNGLKLGDRLALELMRVRIRSMPTAALKDAVFDAELTKHAQIDVEMRRRWSTIVPIFDALVAPDFRIASPPDLIKLVENGELCIDLLNRLAAEDHELLPVLPTLVAGELNNRNIDASWLLEWAFSHLNDRQSPARRQFINVCLPQVFSIAINGRNKYRSTVFKFKEHIEALSGSLQA